MIIANPIYDSVFKYLLEDNELAKLIISTILEDEIVELVLRPQEHMVKLATPSFTVYRLDFAATIKNAQGESRKVLIEIQKAKLDTDLMRFRRYLGNQYRDEENSETLTDEHGISYKQPLPILTIYFLGHHLKYTRAPIIHVQRECYDVITKERLDKKEQFIESLTHDSYIVQIPYLSNKQHTALEAMLQIFDQKQMYRDYAGHLDKHRLMINEDEIPQIYLPLVRRLQKAIADPHMLESMEIEDEILEKFKNMDRVLARAQFAFEQERAEKERALTEKEQALFEKEQERAEKEKVLTEKEQERIAKEHALIAIEQERAEKERLRAKLQQLGIDP